jgi:aldehyde dehydrogenase (NAD+)
MLQPAIAVMRQAVNAGETRSLAWRLEQLERIEQLLHTYENAAVEALASDLGKPPLEANFELLSIRQELRFTRSRLRRWLAPRPLSVELPMRPAKAFQVAEPLGCVLIIGPWNYPLQLCLRPLVSALAAGNTAVLKPSEHAPATARLIETAITESFPAEVVQVVNGDGSVAARLLEVRFDHIFFTGGSRVGRLVMKAAAPHLTPVTLELGGKSPAIVLADADLEVTARRLAWGRCLNAGQTCVAPDHVLVEAPVRDALLTALIAALDQLYGPDALNSPDLGRIVNSTQYQRLSTLLEGAQKQDQLLHGGRCAPERQRIEPTLLAVNSANDPLMQEELFGPLLPIQAVADLEEAIIEVRRRPKPLALYLFSQDKRSQKRVLEQTSSGGVCFNDVVLQAGSSQLPFGGVGESGMGRCHGETGFLTFSNCRTVMRRPFWLDLPLRYPPYKGKLKLMKRLLG